MTSKSKIFNLLSNAFELSDNRKKSISSLEGLRGFAVLLVFFVHYYILFEPSLQENTITFKISKNLWNIGRSGVDLFFILSGFLIYGHLIEKEIRIIEFFKRRAIRIYPVFIAVLGFYLLLSIYFPQKSRMPLEPTQAAIYIIQNIIFLPGIFAIEPIISVAWSLSYEFFFYLIIPLTIWFFSLKKLSAERRVAIFLAIGMTGFVYFWFFEGHIRLLMFLAGIILFDILKTKFSGGLNSLGIIALILSIVWQIVIFESGMSAWFAYLGIFVFYFLLCLNCLEGNGVTTKIFTFAPFRWFGNISYSYYLIHGITINGFFVFLKQAGINFNEFSFWILLLPSFLLTLVPTILLFILIEKPFSLSRSSLTNAKLKQ